MNDSTPTYKESLNQLRNLPQIKKWRDKNFELGSWFTAKPAEQGGSWGTWGQKFTPNQRGVSLVELNRADPRPIPEEGPALTVDRGGGAEPNAERYEYPLNKKYQVWSANVVGLYEEGISRQWSATKDIPWNLVEPLPEDQERALCQFLTALHSVEFAPAEFLPSYISRMDPAYPEVRMFLASQCADEARHVEVFGKRCFVNGGGPSFEPTLGYQLIANPATAAMPEDVIRRVIPSPARQFLATTYSIQVLGEGLVLDYFRFGEFLGRNPCDKQIFRRVLQDEARHASFGTMHIKYYLENAPKAEREEALEMLHYVASVSEAGGQGFGVLMNPSHIEPFALLAARSYGNLDKGWEMMREFWALAIREYLNRCAHAGFPREDRCLLPREAPF